MVQKYNKLFESVWFSGRYWHILTHFVEHLKDFNMNVQRIVDIITSNKLSKIDIASRMKVSRTTLDNLLNGADVKVSTVENLAEVLGVDVAEFFSSDKKTPSLSNKSVVDMNELEREVIALRAENKVLREIQGLSARSQVHVG